MINTKSYTRSGFSKTGLTLVGEMDFDKNGLGQDWTWFLPPKYSWNAAFDK